MSQKRRSLTLKRFQEKSGSRSPILAFYRCSSDQIYLDHDTILTLDSTKINVVTSFTLEIFVEKTLGRRQQEDAKMALLITSHEMQYTAQKYRFPCWTMQYRRSILSCIQNIPRTRKRLTTVA
jgi:hypothetical protein